MDLKMLDRGGCTAVGCAKPQLSRLFCSIVFHTNPWLYL